MEVSVIRMDELTCWAVTVRVSVPSVVRSAAIGIVIVAVPLKLTIAFPVAAPPVMSVALKPDIVYGTDVPAATFVVVSVNTALAPSATEFVEADNA